MIKRFIACLTICLIITGLISPVFSDASALPQPNWNDPGISEIINISDLTGWMLNGGTYDVSTYTDAESFMNDYYYGRTSTKLVDGIDLYYNEFGIGQDLYNIGAKNFSNRLDTNRMMSSSFREHSGYGRRFSEQANEAILDSGSLYDIKIPLLNDVEFANFVGYNHDALRLYSEFFQDDSSPSPSPDPDYISLINIANNNQAYGFFWGDLPQYYYGYYRYRVYSYPANLYSWAYQNDFSIITYSNNGFSTDSYVYPLSGIYTLYITSSNNNYTGRIDNITAFQGWLYNDEYNDPRGTAQIRYNSLNSFNSLNASDSQRTPNSSCVYSGSLYEVMSYFCNRFRNINIYVDGVLWALGGDSVNPPSINPEFPDAVGGEDLPYTTWPISRPRAPYYTSVPGILQAIDDAIQGDGKLDIDDLKPYLTDENGDPVPDPIFDPEPVPIPVPDPVNPDVVPGLPELPVIPLNMPGYNGVSVLAEIINFTNQSLPTSLIVTFWGIVFGIVILGLIKILHK